MENRKSSKVFDELLSRQEYLVVQGNDLAKAFGSLTAFEHKLLDYCFSFVSRDSRYTDVFEVNSIEIFKNFGMQKTGLNYDRVIKAFKRLNEHTALYLPIVKYDGTEAIVMTQLFSEIIFDKKGKIEFKFSERAIPLVFDLKQNFYSFHLRELAQIKGKYALILLKLWEAHRWGNSSITIIQADLERWQNWFLSEKRMSAGIFKRDVLKKAAEELEKLFRVHIILEVQKRGRNVVGYEMQIIDNRTNDFLVQKL